jgi:hypothetical protein
VNEVLIFAVCWGTGSRLFMEAFEFD